MYNEFVFFLKKTGKKKQTEQNNQKVKHKEGRKSDDPKGRFCVKEVEYRNTPNFEERTTFPQTQTQTQTQLVAKLVKKKIKKMEQERDQKSTYFMKRTSLIERKSRKSRESRMEKRA
jgi:hypothetical protein